MSHPSIQPLIAPRTEKLLRTLMEGSSQGVLAVNGEGTICWANPLAEGMFAYAPGEIKGRSLLSLIPGELREKHEVQAALDVREPQPPPLGSELEWHGLRQDGTAFPMDINLGRLNLPEGALAVAFVTDLTERKLLQAERDRFFELSPDLICIARRDGTLQQVNPAFTRQLGWTHDDVFARSFAAFLHPDDAEASLAAFQALLEGEQVLGFKNRYLSRDGAVRWLEWSAPKQSDPMIYAVARDITEAQEAGETEQRLIALIENIPDFVGLAAADETQRVLYVNKAGREMLGLPPLEELCKMRVPDLRLVSDDLAAQLEAGLSANGHWHGEATLQHYRTREPIPVELSNFLVLFHGGSQAGSSKTARSQSSGSKMPLARAMVARDIRERKRIQARLHALTGQLLTAQEEERRRIARDLHDDVTQKLAGLAIELGLLRRRTGPGTESAKLFELQVQVAGVAETLRHLAHEIHPGVLEHAGLGPALEGYCLETSRQRGIHIRYSAGDVPEGIPQEISLVLYRVAQEAIGNAVKHSGAKQVSVELRGPAEESENRLKLIVTDDGKGFLMAEIRDGAGLGLLSIEERVHLVKGDFSIHSNPGAGTRLEVEIPLP